MNENVFTEFAFVRDATDRDMNTSQLDRTEAVNLNKRELLNSYKLEKEQVSDVVKSDITVNESSSLGGIKYNKNRTKDPRPPIFRFTLPSNHKGDIIKELSFIPPLNNK